MDEIFEETSGLRFFVNHDVIRKENPMGQAFDRCKSERLLMAFAQVCMAAGSADTAPIPEGAAHWRKEPQMNNPEPVGLCVIWFGVW